MRSPLRLYVSTITAIGGLALAMSLASLAIPPHHFVWVLFAAAAILTGWFSIQLGSADVSISVADVFFITCAVLYGPSAATVAIAIDSLIMSLLRRGHRSPQRVLFNTAGPALSMFAASKAFFAVAGVAPLALSRAPIPALVFPLLLLTVLYYALNCGLVALAVAIESGQSLLQIWKKHFLWLGTGYFASASVAFCLVLLIQQSSLIAAVIVLPLLVIFHLTLRATFGRVDDARRHFHAMDRLYLSTIETLAMAIDAKDDVTHSHVRRVQTLALAMARAMGITDKAQLKAIEAAALLHDTGKLAVPEHILNKPGSLTPAEFEKMKLHVDVGADILSLVDFPFPVVPIVRCHHENWDGSGYPAGISGTDIPLGARILSVVDCFDALTSDRPYRKRLSNTAAFEMLRERSGRMYDPAVVDTFIRIHPDIVIAEADAPEQRHVMQRIARARQAPPAPSLPVAVGDDRAPDHLLAFVSLSRLASGAATQADVFAIASHLAMQVAPGTSGAWFVPDPGSDRLVVARSFGPAAAAFQGMTIGVGDRLSGWVAATRQMIVNSPAALDLAERATAINPPLQRCLSVPMTVGASLVAVLTLYASQEDLFDEQRGGLLQMVAPHIAQALSAARDAGAAPAAKTSARDLRLVASH